MKGCNMAQKQEAMTRMIRNSTATIAVITLAMAVVAVVRPTRRSCDRDKSGANGREQKEQGSQVSAFSALASLSSFKAERGGFRTPGPDFSGHGISSAVGSVDLTPRGALQTLQNKPFLIIEPVNR